MDSNDCRLCLKSYKRVKPLYESKNGVPYWVMINTIADIKLSGGDLDDKACVSCCRRLVEAYNFKLLIERSESTLRNSNNTKRLIFNNIQDVKIEIEIPNVRLKQENFLDHFQTNVEQFNYHGTLITRVAEADRKPLSAGEYLNSFNEQYEDEVFSNQVFLIKRKQTWAEEINIDDNYEPDDIHDRDYEPYSPDDEHYKPGDEPYNPGDETQNPDDTEVPLNKRKTRNKIYDEIKPTATRSTKKLRNNDDYDDDYKPGYSLKKSKKILSENNETKRPIGRRLICKILPVPIQPQVLDNVRISTIREPKEKKGEQKIICFHCGKLCAKPYLKEHLLTHSSIEATFKCDKCPKAFKSAFSLKTHKKNHGSRSIKCEQCVATFVHKYAYYSHLRHHTNEKNFVCELCSKAFRLKYHLIRHNVHAHNIGVKEIKCDICERGFKSKYMLKHHLRVHTRERPYNCEICSQPYSYKHDFNRHCLNKHGVLFKRRSVYVMNEDVLVKERALMRDLMLRMNGVDKGELPENPFEGPQGHFAYQQMMKFLETQKLQL